MANHRPILSNALETVKRAIAADHAGDYEQALELYASSIKSFLHEIKYSRNEAERKMMTERVEGYMNRAEQIKMSLNTTSKPLRAGGGAEDAAAAAAAAEAAEAEVDDGPFDLREELAKRVGMAEVKEQVLAFEHTLALDKRRRELGAETKGDAPFPHLLFKGPPGCGKTSMARLICKALKSLGVLTRGHLVEVQRGDLVAGHIGQTAIQTRKIIESAKGGVLFVDECYRLSGRGPSDFGPEAIDELMSAMETGNPVMIFAGYNDAAMDEFVASNPGLFRRISSVFVFDAYQTSELAEILMLKIEGSGFRLALPEDERLGVLHELIEGSTTALQRERMNGGICDHILRNAKRHLDARLTIDDGLEEMMTYTTDDLVQACADVPTPSPLPADGEDR
uniref:Vesicle-fusing ATPase n=1 Tax=Florenciella parvula TaxID=236787 RepID=A0A7S2CBY4_9STRA